MIEERFIGRSPSTRWRGAWLVAFLCALGSWPACISAHPHIFIEDSVALLFGETDVRGLRVSYTFDEMYSSMIRTDYVKEKSGVPSLVEMSDIEKKNFDGAAGSNFFLDLKLNGETLRIKKIEDFAVKYRDNKMTFSFTVPLPASSRPINEIALVPFDDTYYIEFTLTRGQGVTVENGAPFDANCNVTRDVERQSELGPVQSDIVKCSYRRKG